MPRIAMGIEYLGTAYYGWQQQENLTTIQQVVETAISQVANERIETYCAGRTDAGVHASAQVVHFDTTAQRSERAWLLGTNVNLPRDVRVIWVKFVPEDFHARFSAVSRRYHYWIYNTPVASAILHQRVTWYIQPLDEVSMQKAANYLLGEHDFSSFRGRDCQARSPVRTIDSAEIKRYRDFILLDISANGFLHHMVRNIMGVLIKVGVGKRKPEWVIELLQASDRRLAGATAAAEGLYLSGISYPDEYAIPSESTRLFIHHE